MSGDGTPATDRPVIRARGLTKHYGHVVAMDEADLDLYAGEVLAVVGDNGAGKSTLIGAISGALTPDSGDLEVDGESVSLTSPLAARALGIETVYQGLAVAPALDVATNLFLGRELRRSGPLGAVLRMTDREGMRRETRRQLDSLGVRVPDVRRPVEQLSGGQRQCVAVARAAAFGTRVVIMDEPTAALGVRESGMVLDLIRRLRSRGLPVILISHNMPQVFDVADRIHIHRLGRRAAVVRPGEVSMADVVGIMTGAVSPEEFERARRAGEHPGEDLPGGTG